MPVDLTLQVDDVTQLPSDVARTIGGLAQELERTVRKMASGS